MKLIALFVLLLSVLAGQAAVFPPSTNGNNVFTGNNTFASPGNSFGGAFIGNGAGLSNVSADGVSSSVSSNGTVGVRGVVAQPFPYLAAAVASSHAGDKLWATNAQTIAAPLAMTNISLIGDGSMLTYTAAATTGGAGVSANGNLYFKNLRFTNSTDALGFVPLSGAIGFESCRIYGHAYSYFANSMGGYPITATATLFQGDDSGHGTIVVSCGGGVKFFNNDNIVAHGKSGNAEAFESNDFAYNYLQGCTLTASGSAVQNLGVMHFKQSFTRLMNTQINVCKATNEVYTPGAESASAAFILAEGTRANGEYTTAIYEGCHFNLANGGPMALLGVVRADGLLELTDCVVSPATNGVIVDNEALNFSSGGDPIDCTIVVRGGNLVPSNFLHPELVQWDNNLTVTNLTASFIVGPQQNASIDMADKVFVNAEGNVAYDFEANILYDNFNNPDSANLPSVDAVNRVLADDDGNGGQTNVVVWGWPQGLRDRTAFTGVATNTSPAWRLYVTNGIVRRMSFP